MGCVMFENCGGPVRFRYVYNTRLKAKLQMHILGHSILKHNYPPNANVTLLPSSFPRSGDLIIDDDTVLYFPYKVLCVL